MAQLIYSMLTSLDGYVADRRGEFSWAVPDEEVLDAVNADADACGTFLYGRRIYELMHVWETDPAAAQQSPKSAEFAAIWQAKDKIVFSSTLDRVHTQRTELRRSFDPQQIQQLKGEARADLTVDGPTLAAAALRAGTVDVVRALVCPVSVGGGLRFLPEDLRLDLDLTGERSFAGGFVQLDYRVRGVTAW